MEKNHDQLAPVVVMVVPLPAQSHLNQLLHLSYKILSYNIPVHYVSSTRHSRQIRNRTQGLIHSKADKINFHAFEVPLPEPPSATVPVTDPHSRALEVGQLIVPAHETYRLHLREPFAKLLGELSETARRVVIIHDTMMASVVQDAALTPNAETYAFHAISAFTVCSFMQNYMGRPLEADAEIPVFEDREKPELTSQGDNEIKFLQIKAGDLYNTTRVLEATWIDLLAKYQRTDERQWAIGPLNPIKANSESFAKNHSQLFQWLEKQEPRSVMYVAFGTTTAMGSEQIKELALGLEQSKTKFIWVLRDADSVGGETNRLELPEGFEARIEGQGMVIREWAPQVEILGHKSIGGFMNHCGWGSCMESISMGVPMAAWPMHSDHPSNAVSITQHLKVGILVRRWEQRDDIISASAISEAVKKLIVSEEGKELRKNTEELSRALQESFTRGGVSDKEFESFIAYISR